MRRTVAVCVSSLLLFSCAPTDPEVALPAARRDGTVSLEAALAKRRSVRELSPTPLSPQEIAQLAWSLQGESAPGKRTAPSAGALYPLETYVATAEGFFHYLPSRHVLRRMGGTDLRGAIHDAALGQDVLAAAPAVFVVTGVEARTARKYGARATRYVAMEAGHAAQNLLLEATALGLGAVPVGAFDDDRLRRALGLSAEETPLYLLPVGRPR